MYCPYITSEVNCNGICYCCSYNPYSNPNGLTFHPQQFNYECPDCHGKFNTPSYKYLSDTASPTTQPIQVCPFCGREMKGLSP